MHCREKGFEQNNRSVQTCLIIVQKYMALDTYYINPFILIKPSYTNEHAKLYPTHIRGGTLLITIKNQL